MSSRKSAARSAATKKSVRRTSRTKSPAAPTVTITEPQRLFLASELVQATLTGHRAGYAEAIAHTAIATTLETAPAIEPTALQPMPVYRFTKLDANDRELPADAQAWSQVRDTKTGLIWCAETLDGKHTWLQAKEAAAASRSSGRSDWRLPTIEELLSIVDYSRTDPAIDTTLFRAKAGYYYWSATPHASASGYAWLVYFHYGSSDYHDPDGTAFVRAVRSVARAGQ